MTDLSVVILAHHDEETRKVCAGVLASEGLRVYEVEHGREALELTTRYEPDAVLLDTELPGLDGIEVCLRLKAEPNVNSPVILTIPASAVETRKEAAMASGADVYLMEPMELEVLTATVRSMVKLGHRLARAEREVANLTERLAVAQAELEQFAAQALHDVEEPLRAVTTFVQLIEERRQGSLSEGERNYLGLVLAASARVRRLLRGFLSYTQVGRKRTHFGPLDLRAAAAGALQAVGHRVKETGTTVHFEGVWPAVWGDFAQLQQVFEQLIGNAIDYRQPGAAAIVTIGVRTGQDFHAVTMADNGTGVPASFHATIFLPFKRLHGREIPGAGMGLAISRRIVEGHGGRMWVESNAEKGATFCFTLPAVEPAPLHSSAEGAS